MSKILKIVEVQTTATSSSESDLLDECLKPTNPSMTEFPGKKIKKI